jgi:SHS2 domain-containing protein
MYETFDHTADLGLRIQSADLDTLFSEAGLALSSALVENLSDVRELVSMEITLSTDDLEDLLFDWLRTLLRAFEIQHLLFRSFSVSIRDLHLRATALGEPFDENRHWLAHEVKAVTYHELLIEQTPQGWLAEVIVDI